MARYVQVFPIVDAPAVTFERIRSFLASKKFTYRVRDGEQLFQKGDGVWVAPSFIKVAYGPNEVLLEAWIDALGQEQNLDGFVGSAAKKPLKKVVKQVEEILKKPGENYVHVPVEVAAPAQSAEVSQKADAQSAAPAVIPSKKEYLRHHAPESFYTNIRINSIIAYVLCGIAGFSALLNPFGWIDVFIYLGLTLGMHLRKSKGCAIGILIYAIFGTVVNLIVNHMLMGWAWLVIGIYSLIVFNNAEKRYKELKKNA